MSARRRSGRENRVGKICISFIVLAFVAVMAYQMMILYQKNLDYEKQETQLQADLADETERAQALEEYEDYVNSDEGYAEIAHSRLGLVKKNEIIYKEEK